MSDFDHKLKNGSDNSRRNVFDLSEHRKKRSKRSGSKGTGLMRPSKILAFTQLIGVLLILAWMMRSCGA